MSLYNDFSPQLLMIIGIVVAILFAIVVFVILRNVIFLHKARNEQDARINSLLLSNMIQRFNIPFRKYVESTTDLDKEKHIWQCQHCHDLDACEDMFLGKDVNPNSFCPNYDDLQRIKKS